MLSFELDCKKRLLFFHCCLFVIFRYKLESCKKIENKVNRTYSPIDDETPILALWRAWAFLARANKVITVRLVGFIHDLGAPRRGRFLAKFPTNKI